MKSSKEFEDAPMFTVFTGPVDKDAVVLRDDEWDLFGIDGGRVCDAEVRRRANQMGIELAHNIEGMFMEPEIDSEFAREGADDVDAALAYVASGGRVVKLPDEMDSKYYRLYPVVLIKMRGKSATEPAPPPEHAVG